MVSVTVAPLAGDWAVGAVITMDGVGMGVSSPEHEV